MAVDQAICSTQQTDAASDLFSGSEPMAPWMDDVALQIWVDAEHSPILVRLTGTLNQATAVNVVPVVGELIADGGRDFELQTPGLRVPDGGGTEALAGVQRLVRLSGGHVTWDAATLGSHGASRTPERRTGVHDRASRYDAEHMSDELREADAPDLACTVSTARPTSLLATLSGGPETGVVLKTAIGLATLLGMEVEAAHVSDEGDATQDVGAATRAVGLELHEWPGPTGDRLLEVLERPQVFGAVTGMRTFISGPRPAGHTALQVLRGTSKPLILVPPEAALPEMFTPRRLLVPLDGSPQASRAFLDMEGLFQEDANVEVVVLYTLDGLTPTMLDHPLYDLPMWGEEFLLRYCPGERRSFQWSTGNPAGAAIDVAAEKECDLIVLSFAGDIEVGHGAVIREVLARSSVPVIVVPTPTPAAKCIDRAARAVGAGSPQ